MFPWMDYGQQLPPFLSWGSGITADAESVVGSTNRRRRFAAWWSRRR